MTSLLNPRGISDGESLVVILWLESRTGEAWSRDMHKHLCGNQFHPTIAKIKGDHCDHGDESRCNHADYGSSYWNGAWHSHHGVGGSKWNPSLGPEYTSQPVLMERATR